jgi:hypothetical protein
MESYNGKIKYELAYDDLVNEQVFDTIDVTQRRSVVRGPIDHGGKGRLRFDPSITTDAEVQAKMNAAQDAEDEVECEECGEDPCECENNETDE